MSLQKNKSVHAAIERQCTTEVEKFNYHEVFFTSDGRRSRRFM